MAIIETHMLKRLLPALVFVGFMYTVTVLLAGRDPRPTQSTAQAIYDGRHILTHVVAFALIAWLLIWAAGGATSARDWAVVIVTCLLLGLGQEILQWANRPVLMLPPLLFDLVMDGIGGITGLIITQKGSP